MIVIKFPQGYAMEGNPPTQHAALPYAEYLNDEKFDSGKLVTQRQLVMNGIFVPLDKYAEVKDFFSKVQAGDEQQAVLRAGGTTSAQKGN